MPRAWAAALTGASALAVTACSSPPWAVPLPPPSDAAAAVDCSAEWDLGWGAIPADFEPVAVYVCDPVLELAPAPTPDPPLMLADPEQLAETPPPAAEPAPDPAPLEARRLEGDLSALLAAFAEPSDPKWPGPCSAIGVVVPDVWLVDDEGWAIRPAYPADGCGLPKPGVGEALAEFTPVD